MTPVENYIYQLEGNQRAIMLYLHELIAMDIGLEDKIRFKIPFYYGNSWICYLNPIKDTQVELAFIHGNELSNEQGLLESKGRKQVCGVTFSQVKEIPREIIFEIVQEAMLVDEAKFIDRKKKK